MGGKKVPNPESSKQRDHKKFHNPMYKYKYVKRLLMHCTVGTFGCPPKYSPVLQDYYKCITSRFSWNIIYRDGAPFNFGEKIKIRLSDQYKKTCRNRAYYQFTF